MWGAGGGVPKTTFRLDDFLELPGFRKAITLLVMIYYSERKQIMISKREAKSLCQLPGAPSQWNPMGMSFILPETMCDNLCEVWSTREEAQPSFGLSSFSGGVSH